MSKTSCPEDPVLIIGDFPVNRCALQSLRSIVETGGITFLEQNGEMYTR